MKEIQDQYKKAFSELIKNKMFVVIVLLVTILSFGFTITNYSIGVDDTCFDRYYIEKEMLSIGRWGSYIVYNILGLTEFTPFWTDFIATSIVMSIAVLWCVFFKKNLKEKIPDAAYIIFASIFISFPIINEIFIYQNCNIAVMLGNLLASLGIMLLYENYKNINKKSIYIICIAILTLGLSMYEACAQIMLVSICITAFLLINEQNKKDVKNIIKYLSISILILFVAVLLNSIIVKIIYALGVPMSDAAEKELNWGKYGLVDSILFILYNIGSVTIKNMGYLPVSIFCIATIIGFVLVIIRAYKKEDITSLLIYIFMVLSNFAISILQLKEVLYRTCISWGLFVAVIFFVFYIKMSKYKVTKILSIIFITILVLQQSRTLSQLFYNDYLRYQRDLEIAFDLIDDLETDYDISKPLVIMGTPKKGMGKYGAQVNSLSVLWWGKKAFNDNGAEFIKFLNSLGYDFKRPNDEQYEKGKVEAETMSEYPKDGSIVELEDCIVINF